MEKVYDVAIIGSGPAGLTAAIYTARGGASTLIVAGQVWGGQLMLTSTIDNFPGFPEGIAGQDLMQAMRRQAERFGAEFLEKNATAVDFNSKPFVVMAGDQKLKVKTVILATGAESRWLGIPGEKELIGRGVSACASCDAPFFKDKRVAVVGGGDTAMEDASTLSKFASEVTLIHRRDKFRASEAMQKKVLENPKVKILWNTEVQEIKGKDKVNSLGLRNDKTGKISELSVDGVFIAVGYKPNRELFPAAAIPGVFWAGDAVDECYKQAVTAAGSGAIAALDALAYLDKS